jgi:hypothetical protein
MTTARFARTARIIPALMIFCFVCLPAYAQYSGGSGTADDPYQIATAPDLMTLGGTPDDYDKHFLLTADIDLDPNLPGRKVFDRAPISPLPTQAHPLAQDTGFHRDIPLTGVLDGNDHEIRNLVIEATWTSTDAYVGLIARIGENGQVKRLRLRNVSIIHGAEFVGALAGVNSGTVLSCSSSGRVMGSGYVGGLVGGNEGGIIAASHSSGSVKGWSVGGLVGVLKAGTVSSSYSTASVLKYEHFGCEIGFDYAGGLVGKNQNGTITSSYSGGHVTGDILAGGLAGVNEGAIEACYSSSKVTGENSAGGLVGDNCGSVLSSYAAGDVTGRYAVGGLVGWDWYGGVVTSYSVAKVTGEMRVGGLVGRSYSTSVHLAYWDLEASGVEESAVGHGKTTEQMMSPETFSGWGRKAQWTLDQGKDYPHLAWEGGPGLRIADPLRTYSGGAGDPNDPYVVRNADDFARIGRFAADWNAAFVLVSHIDLTSIDPNRLLPIGSRGLPFTGTFDGRDHTVRGLHIDAARGSCAGMFGYVGRSGTVSHIHLADLDVSGEDYIGGLVGSNDGSVLACSVTGGVTASQTAGGVVGLNRSTVASSCATGVYTLGSRSVGGLVGENLGSVASCYAKGTVIGDWSYVGGLVGSNMNGTVTSSYSTCAVKGAVSREGGLVGGIAHEYGVVTASFWDVQTSGSSEASGGTGLATTEMQTAATFLEAGWDFVHETENGTDDIWWILEGQDYPRLWWELLREYVVLVVDDLDFESYTNEVSKRVFRTWIDGVGFGLPKPGHPGNGTGAMVGHDIWDPDAPCYIASIMEMHVVHGGWQSMPLYYDNTDEPYYSEAERAFTTPSYWTPDGGETPQDWTDGGADTLTLHIHGRADNDPERLYVAIEDSAGNVAVVRHSNAEAVLVTEWQKWHIALADLQAAGVDIASVAKMTIGLGNRDNPEPGGEGMIYIDDIILTKRMP